MDLYSAAPQPLCQRTQEAFLASLMRRFPFVRQRLVCRSAYGRPMYALCVGRGSRTAVFTAAHHANEAITGLLLWRFLEEYCAALRDGGPLLSLSARELYRENTLWLLPCCNPDGAELLSGELPECAPEYRAARALALQRPELPFPQGWKADLTGVDLNLNFPARWALACSVKAQSGVLGPGPRDYPGERPLCRPETRGLCELLEALRPALLICLHTQGRVIYTAGSAPSIPGMQALGTQLAAACGYTLECPPPESDNAGLKDWFLQRFGKPAFTVEVGEGENPLPLSEAQALYLELLPLLVSALSGSEHVHPL